MPDEELERIVDDNLAKIKKIDELCREYDQNRESELSDLKRELEQLKGSRLIGLESDVQKILAEHEEYARSKAVFGFASSYFPITEQAEKRKGLVQACKAMLMLNPNESRLYSLLGTLVTEDKIDLAFKCYLKAIAINPRSPTAHNLLGCLQSHNKRSIVHEHTAYYFTKASELDPENPIYLYNRGVLLFRLGENIGQAVEDIEKLIKARPKFKRLEFLTYDQLLINIRIGTSGQNAINIFREFTKKFPEKASAHYFLGSALEKSRALEREDEAGNKSKMVEAIIELNKAVELEPDNPEYYGELFRLGPGKDRDIGSLIEAYKKAVRKYPGNKVYMELSNALKEAGRLEEAISEYRYALQLKPSANNLRNEFCTLLFESERFSEAETVYREGIALSPKIEAFYFNLSLVLLKLNKFSEAEEIVRSGIKLNPKDENFYFQLETALRGQGKLEEVISEYQSALQVNPDKPNLIYQLGLIFLKSKKFREAEELFKLGMKLSTNNKNFYFELGSALRPQGKLDEEADIYRTYIRLNPRDISGYLRLGEVLIEKKDFEEASKIREKVLSLHPWGSEMERMKSVFSELDKHKTE